MIFVKPKKQLGQHFLTDEGIASDIANALTAHGDYRFVLEIGPGTGMLTKYLLEKYKETLFVSEIDRESIAYLKIHFPALQNRLIEGDFLKKDLASLFNAPFAIIGNFPYNISSQIFFKILETPDLVPEVVCMLQKEVAERLCSKEGNKAYGILSVFLQAFYDMEYLFTVHEHVFNPPPKVKSGVIRLKRNANTSLGCDEKLFRKVVKQGFNNRRKTLRNALKPLSLPVEMLTDKLFDKRAEQLSVKQFIDLTNAIADTLTE